MLDVQQDTENARAARRWPDAKDHATHDECSFLVLVLMRRLSAIEVGGRDKDRHRERGIRCS